MPSRSRLRRASRRRLRGRPQRRCPADRRRRATLREGGRQPGLLAEADRSSLNSVATRDREAGSSERRRRSEGPCATPSTPRGRGPKPKGRSRGCARSRRPDPSVLIIGVAVSSRNAAGYGPRRPLTKTSGSVVICRRSAGETAGYAALLSPRRESRLRHTGTVAIVDGPAMFFRAVGRFGGARGVRALRRLRATRARKAKEQVEFGIKVAQNGLWHEAIYRWEKAVEIDPTYAAACNNLAIAYEQKGNFDKARKAYEKALQLDPNNLMIRQNYELFKEINDRAKRRSDSLASRSAWPCCAALPPARTSTRSRSRRRSSRRWTCRRSSACSSPASSPAAPRTWTRTSRRCGCCAASCARSRRCA